MDAYTPNLRAALEVVALIGATLFGGFLCTRLRQARVARVLAWGLLIVAVIAVARACAGEPAGVRMLALISCPFLAMKAVVCVEAQAEGMQALRPSRYLAFTLGWVGMQPKLFAAPPRGALGGVGALASKGILRVIVGALFIVAARRTWEATHGAVVSVVLLFLGFGLVFHFGASSISAALWRRRGVACGPICRAPALSRSLAEFWGKRWNLAFSEMASIAVYRPLAVRWGRDAAMLAVFLLSGAFHELAISLPVRAGYGLPTLYFALHGASMWVERRVLRTRLAEAAWAGRAWTLIWVLAPLPLLFHPPFIRGVVLPLLSGKQ